MRARLLDMLASGTAKGGAGHAASSNVSPFSTSSQPWQYTEAAARVSSLHCGGHDALRGTAADAQAAQWWAIAGLFAVLVGGSIGVALPPLWRRGEGSRVKDAAFALCRAFAAGVVLATGLVHMLPASMRALSDPCLGWPDFPWASVLATAAALLTSAIEFTAGQYFSGSQPQERGSNPQQAPVCAQATGHNGHHSGSLPAANGSAEPLLLGSSSEAAHMLDEMAAMDSDSVYGLQRRSTGGGAGGGRKSATRSLSTTRSGLLRQSMREEAGEQAASGSAGWTTARRVATAQVLELGIALHSVLIGVALGVSDSAAAAAPLAAALVFHQTFEGFALGSALTDAGLEGWGLASRGAAFAVTTPAGVAVGLLIRRGYSARSPIALVINGVFNGTSAGILLYMALVDLIAIDFFSARMRAAGPAMQLASYVALFSGATAMSLLAIWA